VEEFLEEYFDEQKSLNKGIPTVQYLAEALNILLAALSDVAFTVV
jgi:AraC family transcriptional regulator, transcriptional activator of pobA